MDLLVSVRSATEATAAVAAGAHIIDAKEPLAGALGAVTIDTFRRIVERVGGERPVTAALGDAEDEGCVERDAAAFRQAGAALVKVGFAGAASGTRVASLLRAAAHSAGPAHVVAVAYADHASVAAPPAHDVLDAAARCGVAGVLIDTADKQGPGLTRLRPLAVLVEWTASAHRAGLFVALAGRLTLDDLAIVDAAGADVAGVRGAACDGGRRGRIDAARIRLLLGRCKPARPFAQCQNGTFAKEHAHVGRADSVEGWMRSHS